MKTSDFFENLDRTHAQDMSDLDNFIAGECAGDAAFKTLWQNPDEDEAFRFGMALCIEREKNNLTIKELARRCGTTVSVIEAMELDIRTAPAEVLNRVIIALRLIQRNRAAIPNETSLQLARRLQTDLPDCFKLSLPPSHKPQSAAK